MSTNSKHTDLHVRLEHGLGGRLFADQRALVLALALGNLLSGEHRQLLDGLTSLLDSVADQAHAQGEDCLLKPTDAAPDLAAHVRAQVLAALPEVMPSTPEEVADLVARALACAPPPTPPAEPGEALPAAERLLAPFDEAYQALSARVMELTRGKSREELEALLRASETVLAEGYDHSSTTLYQVAREVKARVGRRLMYPCPGELASLGEGAAGTLVIRAEAHSDDQGFKVDFNARQWFEQAERQEIVGLAAIGWGGDLEADDVARFMSDHDPQLAEMFRYVGRHRGMGFECSVTEEDALKWIYANRREVYVALCEEGHLTHAGGEFIVLVDKVSGLYYSYLPEEYPLEWRLDGDAWSHQEVEAVPETAVQPDGEYPEGLFEEIGRHYSEAFEREKFGGAWAQREGGVSDGE